jgi:hypothetical protein
MEAPFLWLRFAVVVVGGAVVLVVALLPPLSVLRDGLDREVVVVGTVEAASAKVAVAGVEGLLARPLLVLTTPAGVGWMARAAVSFFGGPGSTLAFVTASFLLSLGVGSRAGRGSSVSGFSGLGLVMMGTFVSF